ncbi:hypothetical protein HPB51_016175 [Rhipicephalus microplus]|uniref:Endonuclease/exonuclease/phosphatase domain-containing protein n=1 Tax=Rhipicephalus microplus TaxID=6941 RepID=A0A9J6E2V2_RHIMP|nr:hypothetical protein HPB51_016175 [Rhipicephalus microplus]
MAPRPPLATFGWECRAHKWVTGNVLGVNTAVCVVYLSLQGLHEGNVRLIGCVCEDARRLQADNELIVIGDFNGHLSELDGHLDANGKLLLQLSEDLDLVIMNLESQWEGQFTWCARGSATNIDYALVSLRLHAMLQSCGVDEEGKYSLGSDHNRLRLDFGHSCHKGKIISRRKKIKSLERKLLSSSLGFRLHHTTSGIDERRRLPGLTFADDILLMAEITKEMQALLDICQDEITRLGLCFNVKKIALLRLVGECTKESVVTLGDAEVSSCTEYRYLGVKLSAPTDMYSLHEAKTREAGLRAQSILWRRCF